MVDWTPEAIEAAHRAMFQEPYDGTTAAMIGAGLDAAAAAQGIKNEEITRLRGQVEALNAERDRLWVEKLKTQGEIKRLLEENARLREALKPLAEIAESLPHRSNTVTANVLMSDLRAAAAAIGKGINTNDTLSGAAAAAIREGGNRDE